MIASSLATLSCVLTIGALGIWFRLIQQVKIPKNRFMFVITLVTSFVMGVSSFALGSEHILFSIAATAGIFGSSLFLLTVAIGTQKGGTGKFIVGQPTPNIIAPDENNTVFDLSTFKGQPILLKFFRGHW